MGRAGTRRSKIFAWKVGGKYVDVQGCGDTDDWPPVCGKQARKNSRMTMRTHLQPHSSKRSLSGPSADGVHSSDSQSFVYHSLQRLTQATGSYGTYGYTYDKDGNRLTQTLGSTTTTYGYGAGNDLLQTMSVSGSVTQTIGYTADGRMASFSPGIASPGGQLITALNYNQDAQLSAVDAGSTAVASYHCNRFMGNGFGQRVLKAFPGGTGGDLSIRAKWDAAGGDGSVGHAAGGLHLSERQ